MKSKQHQRNDPRRGLTPESITKVKVFVAAVTSLAILALIIYIVLPDGPRVDPPISTPTGSFSGVEIVNATMANLTFGELSNDPPPARLNIIVENATGKGTYFFQSDGDESLILLHGDDMCSVTYHDGEGNEKVDEGDYLLFTGLGPKSQYTIQMIWGPHGELISQVTFSTPLS